MNATHPSDTSAFFPDSSTCFISSPRAAITALLRSDLRYPGRLELVALEECVSERTFSFDEVAEDFRLLRTRSALSSDSTSEMPDPDSSLDEDEVDESFR